MDYDKNSEALILCANCKAMDKIDTVENNFVWIPFIKCINNYTGNSLVAVWNVRWKQQALQSFCIRTIKLLIDKNCKDFV